MINQIVFQLFITLMDKLRLEFRAMDMIQPELRDLRDTMDRLLMLPEDFEGKLKVRTGVRPAGDHHWRLSRIVITD